MEHFWSTQWAPNKMAGILHTTYLIAFSWMKAIIFWWKFYRSLFQMVLLTKNQQKSTLFQVMAWQQIGDMPVPEPTRTTSMPAFWGYPSPPHDYPHYWVISDPKSKWKYRSRSKVITCDTPSDANDDLCQIWKECKKNCRFFFKVKAEKLAKNWNVRILL